MTQKRKKWLHQRSLASRPLYYAMHPESATGRVGKVTKGREHFFDKLTGITFRIADPETGALNYRVPTSMTETMMQVYPPQSYIVLTVNGHIREKQSGLSSARVRIDHYSALVPRQKRGRVTVDELDVGMARLVQSLLR